MYLMESSLIRNSLWLPAVGFAMIGCQSAGPITQPGGSSKSVSSSIKENKEGAFEVTGYRADLGKKLIEIEGICELNEGKFACWTPDGSPNPELENEVSAAAKSENETFISNLRFELKKKNRIAVVKVTAPPYNVSQEPSSHIEAAYGTSYDPKRAGEWYHGGAFFDSPEKINANEPVVDRQVLVGHFEQGASVSNLHLRITNMDMVKIKTIPAKAGEIQVGLNKIIIDDVSKKRPKNMAPLFGERPGEPGLPSYMTFVTLGIDEVKDRWSTCKLIPLDASGKQIEYVDDNGKPTTHELYMKAVDAENAKVEQAMKSGVARPVHRRNFYGAVAAIFIEPMKQNDWTEAFYPLSVDLAYLKSFEVWGKTSARYVFKDVKLDMK